MGLKFLNKKGWHTGSLRNIENVWKAEQKHNAEQSKLEELRKQIHEEREKAEFRQLQEQAGLIPRQERLDFLYESGLGVGKTSEGFKALETPAPAAIATANAETGSSKAAAPGALFEEKPQSANDAWRKLHSDPLLLIRQREQEALARIKNNPIKMSMIRKSVEAEKKRSKEDKEHGKKKKHKKKHHHKSRSERGSDSDSTSEDKQKRNNITSDTQKHNRRRHSSKGSSEEEERTHRRNRNESKYSSESEEDRRQNNRDRHRDYERDEGKMRQNSQQEYRSRVSGRDDDRMRQKYQEQPSRVSERDENAQYSSESEEDRRQNNRDRHRDYERDERKMRPNSQQEYRSRVSGRDDDRTRQNYQEQPSRVSERDANANKPKTQQGYNRKKGAPKMTKEEREAKLREMQMDAELHEEQRWRRIKRASEADAQEAARASSYKGKNFLDGAQKSIYGAEKGGSSTIEESVRRRAYYSQGGSAAHESNPFRR